MACGGDEAGCDDTIDDDKDGIGNCTEATLGTDPADDDSDDDGLLDGKEVELETDPLVDDTDADGLLDGQEVDELETDPLLADTDGDGMDDKTEVDCVSSPTDPKELCYACGWPHNDPGTLKSTGSDIGDVAANVQLVDQCGEPVDLWDLAGEYHILYMTAAW